MSQVRALQNVVQSRDRETQDLVPVSGSASLSDSAFKNRETSREHAPIQGTARTPNQEHPSKSRAFQRHGEDRH